MKRWSLLIACAALVITVHAAQQTTTGRQTAPPTTTPKPTDKPAATGTATPTPTPTVTPDFGFPGSGGSSAGMLLFYVKPDKGPNFEQVVDRIREVLEKSVDGTVRQQAAGWKIYKSLEPPKEGDGLVYIFMFDPALPTADYNPVRLLRQSLPAEVQGLYDRMTDALIRVERMGLRKIR